MPFLPCTEEFSCYDYEDKPWEGHDRPIEDLAGTWVNVDSPLEHYLVQGLNVTRTDSRGVHHFTIQWDRWRQCWQWGTHGRLFLEWLADDAIAWAPDVHSHHARVWRWHRVQPTAAGRCYGAPPTLASSAPAYGPGRRPRIHHNWEQPYPSTSGQWYVPPPMLPPGALLQGSMMVPTQRLEMAPSDWDAFESRQHYDHHDHHMHDHRHYNHGCQHHREQHFHRHEHYGYHNRRPRSDHYLDESARLPCGLTSCEVWDLLSREIGPDDYEMLLRLDKTVPKPTASAESLASLREIPQEEFMGGECTVCLSSFEADDSVVSLPCRHSFHHSCVTKWLSECRRMCPLCGAEVVAT